MLRSDTGGRALAGNGTVRGLPLDQTKENEMQHSAATMMKTNPAASKQGGDLTKLAACIDACFDCAQSCTACADACLSEKDTEMLKQCIRLNQDCAAVCLAAGQVLSRAGRPASSAVIRTIVQACAAACAECATECEKHAKMHEHCKACAETCRRCETACKALHAS